MPIVNPIKLKFSCTKNGEEVAIVNKVPRVVSVLVFTPVFDPLLDQGKYLELAGKSTLRLVTPELSLGEEIAIGHEYIVSISQPATSTVQVELTGRKKSK
jgi:hypothetical protein